MNLNRQDRQGFSLIEIVLALGIVSFALTAIFGLVALALQSTKASAEDDVIAFMSRSLASQYHGTRLVSSSGQLVLPNGTTGALTLAQYLSDNPGRVYYRYFDQHGNPCCDDNTGKPFEDDSENPPDGAFYICEISTRDNPGPDRCLSAAASLSGTLSPSLASQMRVLRFSFSWPANAELRNRQTRVIVSGLASSDSLPNNP